MDWAAAMKDQAQIAILPQPLTCEAFGCCSAEELRTIVLRSEMYANHL